MSVCDSTGWVGCCVWGCACESVMQGRISWMELGFLVGGGIRVG